MKPVSKTITVELEGHVVSGTAYVTLWGGDKASLKMSEIYIPINTDITKNTIISCINDNRFGVKDFESADITIYEIWSNGTFTFRTEFSVDCTKPANRLIPNTYHKRGLKVFNENWTFFK